MVARGQKVFHCGQVADFRRAVMQAAGVADMVVEQAMVKEPPGPWDGVASVVGRRAVRVFGGRSSGCGDGELGSGVDMLPVREDGS